jgi:hypothetical protein
MSKRAFMASAFALALALSAAAPSGARKTVRPNLDRLAQGKGWKVMERSVSRLRDGDKKGVRFDARPTIGVAWLEDFEFGDGEIEFDVRGKDELQRSFVGVVFHGVDERTYDAIYFRPFNFKSADALRRLHAVQYISHPEFTWQKLRAEHPGQYEKPVQPIPNPNGWFHVRVNVSYPKVSVYVDGAQEPSLVVEQLSGQKKGWLGFYVSSDSGGDFANLKITPAS